MPDVCLLTYDSSHRPWHRFLFADSKKCFAFLGYWWLCQYSSLSRFL